MVQRNTGVNLSIYDSFERAWIPIDEIYLQEATSYKWSYQGKEPFQLLLQGIPLAMTKCENGWEGNFQTPFQTGTVTFEVISDEKQKVVQYIYPDQRKMTTEHYEQMLKDILKEGSVCFQLEGLDKDVKASGRINTPSYLQWQYIKNNIFHLRTIFRLIKEKPLRLLQREERLLKREHVKSVSQRTITWTERNGERYGWTPKKMPNQILSNVTNETYNRYENEVIVAQLYELRKLLIEYKNAGYPEIQQEAERFLDWITAWKNSSFLQGVKPFRGTLVTSQSFRKHPFYKAWFKWFVELYNFQDVTFDMKQKLSLKETYEIYEIWVYLQLVKTMRELNFIENYKGLFVYEEERFFLALAKHRESKIKLKNGGFLTFQRVIQNNSNPFYSFTQRMIPDITLEYSDQMFIFDPKYRVDQNIPHALAEMHKYRDGIISRSTNEKVVKEAFIVTPTQGEFSEEKNFYSSAYHKKYKMGAIKMTPGQEVAERLKTIIKRLLGEI